MGKIKRLLDRFDEMGRYPIQELGYSRTWLMFSYLGAFLVHRCTIADYFLYHFYERNRRGRAEFVTLYDMRDIHRKNPQTAFADFEEKDRFLDRFQAYVHRDWIGRVCRNSREEFDAFADRHPRCIIKPRTDSGGHGVELCTITPNNRDQVWERLTSQDMIAEELLEQCPEMAALHPSSVNTVRALTIRGKLCSAVLRMGVGGGFVDNGCSGGIFAGLDVDTGIVTTQGADLMEHRFLLHPHHRPDYPRLSGPPVGTGAPDGGGGGDPGPQRHHRGLGRGRHRPGSCAYRGQCLSQRADHADSRDAGTQAPVEQRPAGLTAFCPGAEAEFSAPAPFFSSFFLIFRPFCYRLSKTCQDRWLPPPQSIFSKERSMYRSITLPNGAKLLTEFVPGARTAALGFFVGTGSRHERAAESGAAHFIEHMSFKGTQRRDAGALARETDAIGGQINAYTTKELTCYYARCLDSHLHRAIDLLSDMLFHSRFAQGDVELERGVILEEIGMYEDTPEDLAAERLAAAVYQGSPLSRPILGKASTLNKMTGESLRAYQEAHYRPGNLVTALTGSFTPQAVEELRAILSELEPGHVPSCKGARYRPAFTVRRKPTEQNHLILAFPAFSYLDPRRYQLLLLNSILGGGVSSRLFQELREKRGLCYTTYSYVADHADTGLLGVYTALSPELEGEALDAACALLRELAEHGPTQEELERAREQVKASVLMGLESIQARMSHLGTSQLLYGSVLEQDDILDAYDAVTVPQLRQMAEQIFDFSQLSLSAVGRVPPAEEYAQLLSP